MNKLISVVLSGLILAGCASQRPPMPDENYVTFAGRWLMVDYCAWKGWMDVESAAKGRRYINNDIATWTYDPERLKSQVGTLQPETSKVSQGDCRRMAVSIQERSQQIANQNARADMQQREAQNMINATKPTNTYCNKIGTQVLCNSF